MTNQEQFIEVYKQLQEAQRKYVYFLLAIAGACIAIAVKYSRGESISMSLIPLAIAVVFWGGSFLCGCRFLNIQAGLLHKNAFFLKTKDKYSNGIASNISKLQKLGVMFEESFEKESGKGETWGKWQLKLIFYGSLFFIEWHFLEMLDNSFS